jgi:predicted glycoside hydrolase/deacetylase ChbG (UPF0249 family)
MTAERFLIVNADDLGMSDGVTAGILQGHADGIVTSTSLMVRQAGAADAVRLAGAYPRLAIGLHLDLGQWDYAGGSWFASYRRCDTEDLAQVRHECRGQLEAFRDLTGADPTHLDSHQHVHQSEPAASVAQELAAELGVPLRAFTLRYEGGFYGQTGKGEPYPAGITPAHLAAMIAALPAGWTEIGCHPGIGVGAESSYGPERELELAALCDPEVAAAVAGAGIALLSFADFATARQAL